MSERERVCRCGNLLRTYLDDQQHLVWHCVSCGFQKVVTTFSVIDEVRVHQATKGVADFTPDVIELLMRDDTYARKGVKCPSCDTRKDTKVVYQSESQRALTYVHICGKCNHVWDTTII